MLESTQLCCFLSNCYVESDILWIRNNNVRLNTIRALANHHKDKRHTKRKTFKRSKCFIQKRLIPPINWWLNWVMLGLVSITKPRCTFTLITSSHWCQEQIHPVLFFFCWPFFLLFFSGWAQWESIIQIKLCYSFKMIVAQSAMK